MIIHSYIQVPCGMGFGDFLRGTLSLYQLCARERLDLKVTFKNHPIGNYLIYPETEDIIIHDLNNKCDNLQQLRKQLIMISPRYRMKQKNIGVLCNTWPRFPITSAAKSFLHKVLTPNELCKSALDKTALNTNYEIIHIRTGDMLAFKTAVNFTVEYDVDNMISNLVNHISDIKKNTKNECILMCDSDEIKKILSERCDILATSSSAVHMNVVTDHNAVLDTLVDFFILTKAQCIYQFSVHNWGSTFSNVVEWIYDVPVKPHMLI